MKRPLTVAALAIVAVLVGYTTSRLRSPGPQTVKAAAISWPCILGQPAIISTIPNDSQIADQNTMNCFAWQEFIALNWAAAPGQRGVPDPKATPAQFGASSTSAVTVWETYKAPEEIFLPGGAKPPGWNTPPPAPACKTGGSSLTRNAKTRVFSMSSAFGDFSLDETNQASGQWLADQNGNLVWYEVRLNSDEFNFIVNNQFYNANTQYATASTGTNPAGGAAYQVQLPAGCLSGTCPNNGPPVTGAIELKASWRVLTDPTQYPRYLTTNAVLVNNGSCATAIMGLVGLHIVHKTVTQAQFIWATFEHIDNVPPVPSGQQATFNNGSCACQTPISTACETQGSGLFQNCTAGQSQGSACTPNVPPPYNATSTTCKPYPIQVTRRRPILNNSTDLVAATNTAAVQLITSANPQSVFQYYQLVDVLWSGSPQPNYTNQTGHPGPQTPLSQSGATPDPHASPVANTTMETYVQSLTCLSCHVHAAVAATATVPRPAFASDYSFLFGRAQYPPSRALRTSTNSRSSPSASASTPPRRTLPKGLVRLAH